MKAKMLGSFARKPLRQLAFLCLAGLFSATFASAQTPAPEWRTWTSNDGAQIEAYLREVRENGQIVIVRRDGQEFVTALDRFSEQDRQYVAQQAAQNLPSLERFREVDLAQAEFPRQFRIEGVPHIKPKTNEPIGVAAVQMVLQYHGVSVPGNLVELMRPLQRVRDRPVAAADIQNVLESLPVKTEILRHRQPDERRRREDDAAWEQNIRAIKTAISWGLPVIVAYRSEDDVDSFVNSGVAIGYNARELEILLPEGSRSPIPIDFQVLDFRFSEGLIVFPTVEAVVPAATAEPQLDREFLSSVSQAIMGAPEFTSAAIATALQERNPRAAVRDVNRADLQTSLGQTRSFARAGGLQFVDTSLRSGNVVVLPQELERGQLAFLLIYGNAGANGYYAVQFNPDRTFTRGVVDPAQIANRWMTREDRTYRLDLIEIPIPAAPATEPATQRNSRRTR